MLIKIDKLCVFSKYFHKALAWGICCMYSSPPVETERSRE
ncbi:Uncharacterized protein ChrSV_2245 [Chromobacterium vaccinii]|nr:Uncharacterized protein ChrSW_2245 [Chromobacterium vaccinii]QND89703.1 Uncharacterized protein ChrSV_2245 [Chromobacterium vaccinii]